MNNLRFTEVDLEANRQGRLTDAQRKRLEADVEMLWQKCQSEMWSLGIFGAFVIALIYIAQYFNADEDLNKLFSGMTLIGCSILPLILVLVLGMWGLVRWVTITGFAGGTVRSVEGTAKIVRQMQYGRNPIVFPVNNIEIGQNMLSKSTFSFQDAESLRYFETGKYYRVYFVAYLPPQVLSCEELPEEKAKR